MATTFSALPGALGAFTELSVPPLLADSALAGGEGGGFIASVKTAAAGAHCAPFAALPACQSPGP